MTARQIAELQARHTFSMPDYWDMWIGRTCAVLTVLLLAAAARGWV